MSPNKSEHWPFMPVSYFSNFSDRTTWEGRLIWFTISDSVLHGRKGMKTEATWAFRILHRKVRHSSYHSSQAKKQKMGPLILVPSILVLSQEAFKVSTSSYPLVLVSKTHGVLCNRDILEPFGGNHGQQQ